MDFLYQNKTFLNTFLISDIENFGLSENNSIFTYINEDQIQDVILYFYGNLVIFLKDEHFDKQSFIKIVKSHNVANILLVGIKPEILVNILKEFGFDYTIYTETFMKLNIEKFKQKYQDVNLKSLKIKFTDINLIVQEFKKIDEFKGFGDQMYNEQYLEQAYNIGSYFGYIIKQKDHVLSHAASSAVTNSAIMLGRIFTIPSARHKGYAFDCIINLCHDIIKINKTPILFSNNLNAIKLYEKIGFEPIGDFIVLTKNN
ncbi:GNAT family N-acetyltransferase [Mycoplasma sp. 1578d]|uniref:GNAT family N-acetyltransferase n=1 Tax=Mycoplasma sp. 1578d TaxID=2967299 RepID=UPI00211B99D9|nr:GNAT family N-acetyltransferase [Mycoplasma sp. 1578d]UUM19764.1 GNAT family N-acetyltransferase [Mycoplasma sp. 1578d]